MSITDNATGGENEPDVTIVSESQDNSQGDAAHAASVEPAVAQVPEQSTGDANNSEDTGSEDTSDNDHFGESATTSEHVTPDAESSAADEHHPETEAAEASLAVNPETVAEEPSADDAPAETATPEVEDDDAAHDDSDDDEPAGPRFADLGLPEDVLEAVERVGYQRPSAIQAETIPFLMAGRDVVGLAQTGTGKTAAFALPILARIDASQRYPQALVLAPTRELALQVADSFQTFADHVPDLQILPIYGGQAYGIQLSGLRRGAQIIVGTPGRIIDHLEKGSLDISELRFLVLDEADEMLNMGFQEDVERILEDTPEDKQVALFSATMPNGIRRLSRQYLDDPAEVTVEAKTRTNTNINQRYLFVTHRYKMDAMTRILEVTDFDGMIVFVRTKHDTEEIADQLRAKGFNAAAINGDIAQAQRERTVDQLKDGRLDILVATDVAARGLDVDRISHVMNYDIPRDTESYVHRIGRTGRAGRSGEAILFVTPRERRMLRSIERATHAKLEEMDLPSVDEVNEARKAKFAESITSALSSRQLDVFRELVRSYSEDKGVSAEDIAAALAAQAQGEEEFLMKEQPRERRGRDRFDRGRDRDQDRGRGRDRDNGRGRGPRRNDGDFDTYRLAVGKRHNVRPGAIVGAIANEGGLNSRDFGRITIGLDHTLVELPKGLDRSFFDSLHDTRISGERINIERDRGRPHGRGDRRGNWGRGRDRDDHRSGWDRDDRRGGRGQRNNRRDNDDYRGGNRGRGNRGGYGWRD